MNIAIVSQVTDDKYLGIKLQYAKYFQNKFDARIIPLPLLMTQEYFTDFAPFIDLLVLGGGADISPDRYKQAKRFTTQTPDYYLEEFDRNILHLAVYKKIPIFGICRGFQTLNVFFGGELTQSLVNHPTSLSRGAPAHPVFFLRNKLLQQDSVNSLHHQGIKEKQLANTLEPLAYFSEDTSGKSISLIEAFKHKTLPIAGVQWHPEELNKSNITDIILSTLNI